jgi:thioredoxin-like negative regulator of GroEL
VLTGSALLLVAALVAGGCAGSAGYRQDLERGEVALGSGDPDDAEDAFRRALVYRPEDPAALHGLVRCHVVRGEGESALAVLARLERSDPRYFREHAAGDQRFALYQAAKHSLWGGDSSRALARLHQLEQLDPHYGGLSEIQAEARLAEAGRLYVAGRSEEAQAVAREALGTSSDGPDAALELAQALLESGRLDMAISVLSDALVRYPRDARLRVLMDRSLEIRYPQ